MSSARHIARDALRSLVQLPEHGASRLGVATRASLSIAVPLGVCTALGQQHIGLQTAAGAFTALYAAQNTARERAKILPFVALAFWLSALLGVLLTPWTSAYLVGLVAIAGVASALCFSFRLGPPGPVFFVLVYGLASNVTQVTDEGRANDPLIFLVATAGGAAFAYLLAILPLALPSARALPARPLSELLPGPWFGADEQLLTARIVVASTVGALISFFWLDPSHAYWTVCACVAVVGLAGGRTLSVTRGLHRTVGTLLGAALYMLVAPLGSHPWVLLVLLAALQFIIEFVVVRNYALALIFVTPLVLLVTAAVGASASSDPSATALERVADTVVGAALAVATGLMHRRNTTNTGRTAVIATAPAQPKPPVQPE